ncbi:hypothetical protein [Planotetraspora kaengkrachanensis]|uniref:Uncharacterized protein n=1 Tax=Planotetraspora kaengkrachanensis TaxID=575193 RepID=A0A8J3PYL6_9ACTN|nr:hypothetical protein [Planotetraspora kaengkrachanensis]GIG83301.1 hypothetical protein Pka01_64280 [Planotetraspora kaengkrachanensis]
MIEIVREVLPEERVGRAEQVARHLVNVLATKHNIPADVHVPGCDEAVVSVFVGLLARTDGRSIWWSVPNIDGNRKRPFVRLRYFVPTAAAGLADDYATIRGADLGELLASGRITHVAAELAALWFGEEVGDVASPV